MKIHGTTHSINAVQTHSVLEKQTLQPDIVVCSGINELDTLLGGFKAGDVTFIDGDSDLIATIPNQVCVHTFRTFASDTIYVDGGLCANPYTIAQYARWMELDQNEVLNHIHISRAFTVYQLSTLLNTMLEPAIKRYHPRTLIIGRLPVLYLDTDVKTTEAQTLLAHNLQKIHELATTYHLITIVTNPEKGLFPDRRGIRTMIYEQADEIVRVTQREKTIHLELIKQGKEANKLLCVKEQRCLQEFGVVI